jgi:hypothetical protein
MPGLPRRPIKAVNARATRLREIDVSRIAARHSRVTSSTMLRMRKRRPRGVWPGAFAPCALPRDRAGKCGSCPSARLPDAAGQTAASSRSDAAHWQAPEVFRAALHPPAALAYSAPLCGQSRRCGRPDAPTGPKRRRFEHLIRQQLLQLCVLVLERLQARRFRSGVLARQISDLRARFLLPQNLDDLLFREPLLLHLVRPAIGRTLIHHGGISQGQVTGDQGRSYRYE